MKKTLELIGEYYILMTRVFQKPDKWKIFWKQYAIEAYKLIIDSIPIVTIISVFIGAVIVIQTANNMDNPFIPKMYIGYMAREMLALEFCSTMVALILAGKIGSNIASEIGSMRITEQIDAMEMMGVNSANYLILPKIVSATTLSPLLMLLSFMVGLLGGAMIVIYILQYDKNCCVWLSDNINSFILRLLCKGRFTWCRPFKYKGDCDKQRTYIGIQPGIDQNNALDHS